MNHLSLGSEVIGHACLNEDILVAIFYEVVCTETRTTRRLQHLLCLTHICRAWRAIALGLAELWGEVVLLYPSRWPHVFEVFLNRARDAPLATPLPPLQRLNEARRSFILSHPTRFRALEVTAPLDWAPVLAAKRFPWLTRISISMERRSRSEDVLHAPSLQFLKLGRFKIHLAAPELRSLTLKRIRDLSTTWLRDLLASVPKLQRLTLLQSLPTAPVDIEFASIDLPSVRFLELEDDALTIAVFMERLIPLDPDIEMKLSICDEGLSLDNSRRLARVINPYVCNSARDTIRLSTQGPCRDMFIISHSSPNPQTAASEETSSSTIHLRTEYGSLHPFAALLELLPVAKIRHLHLMASEITYFAQMGEPIYSAPQLADLDRVVYHLENMYWNGIGASFFDRPTVYAQLKTLELHFSSPTRHMHVITEFIDMLRMWLEARIASGLPVLEIRLCGRAIASPQSTQDVFVPYDYEAWSPIRTMLNLVDEREREPT